MPSTITANQEKNNPGLIVITSTRVVLDENENASPATLEISSLSGKFVTIYPRRATADEYPSTVQFIDCGDLVIMPGLVDCHVHIDEP